MVHPDIVMLVITGIIGVIAIRAFKADLGNSDSMREIFNMLGSFLFPCLILAETISMHKKFFVRKFRVNMLNGVISNIVNITLTYYGLKWTGIYTKGLDSTPVHDNQLIALAVVINMCDDTGYKMIMMQTRDRELYKITRERTVINFFVVFLLVYMENDEENATVATSSFFELIYKGLMVMFTSGSIGMGIGIFTTIVQKNASSIRSNVMAQVMFIFCTCYLCSFMSSVKSFYMNEDIALIIFGMVVSMFCRYNLSIQSAKTLGFLLQFLSKMCRLVVLCLVGLGVVNAMLKLTALWIFCRMQLLVMSITLTTHTIFFFIIRLVGEKKLGVKEFMLMYFTSISKGPMVFIIAIKYLPETIIGSESIELYLVANTFISSACIYLTCKYFEEKETDDQLQEKIIYQIEQKMSKPDRPAIATVINYVQEQILCPLMIFDYHRRKEKGVLAKLRSVFYMSLRESEVALINTGAGRKKSIKNHIRDKGDILNLFARALSKTISSHGHSHPVDSNHNDIHETDSHQKKDSMSVELL